MHVIAVADLVLDSVRDVPAVLYHAVRVMCIQQVLEPNRVRYALHRVLGYVPSVVVAIVVPVVLRDAQAVIQRVRVPAMGAVQLVVEVVVQLVLGVAQKHAQTIVALRAGLTGVQTVLQLVVLTDARARVI